MTQLYSSSVATWNSIVSERLVPLCVLAHEPVRLQPARERGFGDRDAVDLVERLEGGLDTTGRPTATLTGSATLARWGCRCMRMPGLQLVDS